LQEQSAQIALVGNDAKAVRLAVEQHEARMIALESKIAAFEWWIKGGISLLVVLAAVLIGLLVHLIHLR
jgi:hypothetical protein